MAPSHHRRYFSFSSNYTTKLPPNSPKFNSSILPPKSLQLFSTILFCLLLASSFLHAISSFLHPTYFIIAGNNEPAQLQSLLQGTRARRFTGRRFLSAAGLLLRTAAGGEVGVIEGDESLLCDRSHLRTDVCVARGDVRVVGSKVMVMAENGLHREEKLRPYTRKWEESVMSTIDEVVMERRVAAAASQESSYGSKEAMSKNSNSSSIPSCDVRHDVPAIVFSTGGYTGNVYHEFNDGIIPLFLTAAQLKGEVVLMVLEYHPWWMTKYAEIVSQISRYEVVDMASDRRVHCFREVKVGLHIHDELMIDRELQKVDRMQEAMVVTNSRANSAGSAAEMVTMEDFRAMLSAAYMPRLEKRREQRLEGSNSSSSASVMLQKKMKMTMKKKPKLVMVLRESPRALVNEDAVRREAETIGFEVMALRPRPTTEMVDIYEALQGCDVMMGVHGAAMTHLLFMRPGATFIQVVPLGTQWAAETYYGRPAAEGMGLRYVAYEVSAAESSLSRAYPMQHPVLTRPDVVNAMGWEYTKRIYLDSQDVILSLPRLRPTLEAAAAAAVAPS